VILYSSTQRRQEQNFMIENDLIRAFNYFKVLPTRAARFLLKRKYSTFLNNDEHNFYHHFDKIKKFITGGYYLAERDDVFPEEGDVELFINEIDNFKIDSTLNVGLQEAAILFNQEGYLFGINNLSDFKTPLNNQELLAYVPTIDFLYSGGAHICALIYAKTQIENFEIKILAHVVPPTDANQMSHNLKLIGEKLRLTVIFLIKQNKINLPQNFHLEFELFGTTPSSLYKFINNNIQAETQTPLINLDFNSLAQNQEPPNDNEEDFISILVTKEATVIEANEEIIFDTRRLAHP
jgi:hypothetical protein